MENDGVPFTEWLSDSLPVKEVSEKKYRHRRLDEIPGCRQQILPRLKQVVFDAHEDFRRDLRKTEGVSLDPLDIPPGHDPAAGYPGQTVHPDSLMGYFGEILTGIFCEKFAPFGETRWQVPAYLFRFHHDEDRHLDQIGQTGKNPNPDKEKRPGRTGEDCLAFVMDDAGKITRALICEAKCRTKSAEEVHESHKKVSGKNFSPLDRRCLIKILQDYEHEDPKAALWVKALQQLRLEDQRAPDYQRFDLVCCIYGTVLKKESRIPRDEPCPAYQGGRPLEAVEIYIEDVREIVRQVYECEGVPDDID